MGVVDVVGGELSSQQVPGIRIGCQIAAAHNYLSVGAVVGGELEIANGGERLGLERYRIDIDACPAAVIGGGVAVANWKNLKEIQRTHRAGRAGGRGESAAHHPSD